MKTRIFIVLSFILTLSITSAIAQVHQYEAIVSTNTEGKIKGSIEAVTADALTIRHGKEKLITIKPVNIKRIRVKRKSMGVLQGFLTGTATGAVIGSTAFLGGFDSDVQGYLFLTATGAGAVAGTGYGLISSLANRKLSLEINNSAEVYGKEYQRLQIYVQPFPFVRSQLKRPE